MKRTSSRPARPPSIGDRSRKVGAGQPVAEQDVGDEVRSRCGLALRLRSSPLVDEPEKRAGREQERHGRVARDAECQAGRFSGHALFSRARGPTHARVPCVGKRGPQIE